jgi:hypothetical protein
MQKGINKSSQLEYENLPTLGEIFGWVGRDCLKAGGDIQGVFICDRHLSIEELIYLNREGSYGLPSSKREILS